MKSAGITMFTLGGHIAGTRFGWSKANSRLMQVPKGYIILINEVMDSVRDEA
jgi:hypothetical protein